MNYRTLTHITRNEAGEQEVEIVYRRGFWRWLFLLPERTETYVGSGCTVWYRKGTGKRAGTLKEIEICNIVERLRQMKVYGT